MRVSTAVRRVTLWPLISSQNAVKMRRCHPPDPYRSIEFLHIRKTAGTSIFNAFLSLGGEEPRVVLRRMERAPWITSSGSYVFARNFGKLTDRYTPHFFGFSHEPVWQMHIPKRAFRFTVLRDPMARVVSLFRYLADPRADAFEVHPAEEHERGWAAGSFREFLERIPEADLLGQLYMFSQTLDPSEAADRIRACELWFFTESFDTGIAELSKKLGLSLAARCDRVSKAKTPDWEDLAILRERLTAEYRLMSQLRVFPGANFVGGFPN